MTRRALLVGYGRIGAKRAQILRDFGWNVTIWEPNHARNTRALVDGFKDVQPCGMPFTRVVNGATIAFVCSPPLYHAEHAICCLEQGCHVFIEKPIAHTLMDAHEICSAAAASDKHVMVGCNYRFWEGLRFKPEQLDRIEISMRYHLPTARPNWRESYVNDPAQGGVVLDSGAHAVDLAQWLVGSISRIHHTAGQPGKLGGLVEDAGEIQLVHRNGIITDIALGWTSKRDVREVWFFLKNGPRWVSNLWDGTDAMFKREMRAFLRSVTRVPISSSPPNPPEEATETLRWCIEARDMVRDGLAKVAL